ncbi:hypothetical protein V3C99_010462 [Haemonchus contortus]|uniref:G_PROTEIN_RECEP_F1_2 domain-containing protein n=1 Tax=Haemonchus contortus TaxID=6289 RepID=A0A7I4Y816_HAECO
MSANESRELQSYEPSDLIVTVVMSCYIFYTAAIVIGIPCNAFVLYRMTRLSRKCAEVYSNGVGLCLFIMAVADIGSLCSILIHYILSIFTATQEIADSVGVVWLDLICKFATLSMHISTFVSIWSWLLMSTLRYLSVYQPLLYIRLWKFPAKAMFTVISAAVVCNAWLVVSVESNPTGGCTMVSLFGYQEINKAFLLIESTISFIIPTLTIIYMDASVLLGLRFKLMAPKAEQPDLRRNIAPSSNRHPGYLWRWLVIALIDVGLNAPENLSRLGLILGIIEYNDDELFYIYRIMAQVPYYLQFGFNGFYLVLFIYDKSTRPQRRRLIESFSADHHNTERPRETLGSLRCRASGNELPFSELHPVECNSMCDSGIEDEPGRC